MNRLFLLALCGLVLSTGFALHEYDNEERNHKIVEDSDESEYPESESYWDAKYKDLEENEPDDDESRDEEETELENDDDTTLSHLANAFSDPAVRRKLRRLRGRNQRRIWSRIPIGSRRRVSRRRPIGIRRRWG